MILLYILFGALGVLAVVSIILGILNWVQISASSSKVAYLETEVDKKTREFDAIKKEKALAAQTLAPQVLAGGSGDEDTTVSGRHDDNSEIEIVRNVRSGIDSPERSILSRETTSLSRDTIAQYMPQDSQNGQPEPGPSPFGATQEPGVQSPFGPPQPQAYPPPPPPQAPAPVGQYGPGGNVPDEQAAAWDLALPQTPNAPPQGYYQGSDVLEVVNERGRSEVSPPTTSQTLTIPLYSETLKDADFASAWQILVDALPRLIQPAYIVLDLNGIGYLYDNEISYLEQFAQTVATQGGSLVLVNCRSDIAAVLQANPTLAPLVAST